jgi:alpha-galactosidase
LGIVLLVAANSSTLFALSNDLARVPYMGWSPWYANAKDQGDGWKDFTLADLKAEADALVTSGLRDHGYRIVWLDAGWANARKADGSINPRIDLVEFCRYMHSRKLKAGAYTDTVQVQNMGN